MTRLALAGAMLLCFALVHTAHADDTNAEFFEKKVRPILVAKCQSCHSTASKKSKGGLLLDNRDAIVKGGDSGPAIVMSKPAESLLLKAVNYNVLEMPPSGKLPAAEIAILTKWVELGAVWPAGSVAVPPGKHDPITRDGSHHWAWQPLKLSPLPAIKDARWPRNPIDHFVLAGLEANSMTPASPADRRTLIRRAYLDLTGLPPPPDEVEAFVNDSSATSYEKLIDRLLASPQYGERWGRHWLDVARYSDGMGGFLDAAALPDAWRYRDWVVKAFNTDMPYDRFVKLQIAGDLIAGSENAVATGFLAIGPTYTDDGGDPDSIAKARAETLDDRVDTVTRAFLGLTVSCARCHDHKFDPIPQADYYSLAGVFNNTRNAHTPVGPAAVVRKFEEHALAVRTIEEQLKALKRAVEQADVKKRKELEAELKRLKNNAPQSPNRFHVVADAGAADMPIAIRGDLRKPGAIAPRRFLSVLSGDQRQAWTNGSGRLQLAEAIANPANPLVSRVMVNRVWLHHFGQPLVRTASNFGQLGEKPSHPELLDWLASQFVKGGWSLKTLHKTIMLSSTYRLSSAFDAQNFRIDGDNRRLWRMTPRRLDVEAWRDSLFAVTGELDSTIGGPPLRDILGSSRRTLYASVSRNGDRLPSDDFLRLFDFPSARATAADRPISTVPQQYLFLLNSPFMAARAKAFANRLATDAKDDSSRIDRAYQLLYARPPTADERDLGIAFLGADDGKAARWPQYTQVLLSSHEFMQIR